MIPLVAEDHLLDWLQHWIANSNKSSPWNDWLDLIKMIRESAADDEPEEMKRAEIEPEIFESNEINIFGETLYITYKCYLRLMQCIDVGILDAEEKSSLKSKLNTEYPELCEF